MRSSALYERYFPSVFDFLTRLLRNREEAADVAQDTFIKALEQLSTLKNPDRFKSWLFTIAHRRGLNRIRSSKRTVAMGVDDDERATMAVADADPSANPEEMAAIQEAADIVWEAAAGLDPRTYAVMDLHVRQGLDSAEIAEVMGVTKGNAYTMVSRMKQSFSNTLATYLLVRKGRQDCDDLAGIVEPDASKMTPELRRKADRHVAKCGVCSENRALLFEPVKMFAALMLVPVPAGLKAAIWGSIAATGTAAAAAGTGAAAASGDETAQNPTPAADVIPIEAAAGGSRMSPGVLSATAAAAVIVVAAVIGGMWYGGRGPAESVALSTPGRPTTTLVGDTTTSTTLPGTGGAESGETGGTPSGAPPTSPSVTTTTSSTTTTAPPDLSSLAFGATDDRASLDEDTAVAVDVTANDTGKIERSSLSLVASPRHGRAVASSNGIVTYEPDANFVGSDTLTYSVTADSGEKASATVTFNVRQVNDVPVVPGPGVLALPEDSSVGFDPLEGATDIDGDDLVVATFDARSTAGGVVSDGGARYTPPADFSGADTFSYKVSDGTATVPVTVTVAVDAMPDAPKRTGGALTTSGTEDVKATFSVLSGWTDADGDAISAVPGTVTSAKGGTVVTTAAGAATYTPPLNFHGTDTFTYKVTDGNVTVSATATVNVASVNDAPNVQNASFTVNSAAPPGTVVGRVVATDPDGAASLTYVITAGNTGSQLRINSSGDLVVNAITDTSDFPLALTVRVSDDGGLSDTATVTVSVVDNTGPTVTAFKANPTTIYSFARPGDACSAGVSTSVLSATVTDPSGIASVSFAYTGIVSGRPFSGTIVGEMSGTTASADFAIVIRGFRNFEQADFAMSVTATDAFGHSTTVGGVTVTVLNCP